MLRGASLVRNVFDLGLLRTYMVLIVNEKSVTKEYKLKNSILMFVLYEVNHIINTIG